MKKFNYLLLSLMLASCGSTKSSDGSGSDNFDTTPSTDTVTQVEETASDASQKTDTIQKIETSNDSTQKVNEIRAEFGPSLFLKKIDRQSFGLKNDVYSMVKKLNFIETGKKFYSKLICYNCGSDDEGYYPGYKVTYENKDLGVTLTWTYREKEKVSDINDVNGIDIKFADKELEKEFISKLVKMGLKKHGNEYYNNDAVGMIASIKNGVITLSLTW